MKKRLIIAIFVLLLIVGFFYFKSKNQTPKVEIGEKMEDLGSAHVEDIYGIKYSSNPPTSGPHFPVWAKAGIYDRLISDGYLIHSMEHGYIVIWYNCDKISAFNFNLVKEVSAHGDEPLQEATNGATVEPLMHMGVKPTATVTWITPEAQPEIGVKLPMSFETNSCKNFVEELKPYLNTAQRVIIAPRVNMENKLSLTAWNRVLKLDNVDKEKMELFIKTYHNKGPEKTME